MMSCALDGRGELRGSPELAPMGCSKHTDMMRGLPHLIFLAHDKAASWDSGRIVSKFPTDGHVVRNVVCTAQGFRLNEVL